MSTTPITPTTPVSAAQVAAFQCLTEHNHEDTVIVSGFFGDVPVAYIGRITHIEGKKGEEASLVLRPVAILIDNAFIDALGDKMLDPDRRSLASAKEAAGPGG